MWKNATHVIAGMGKLKNRAVLFFRNSACSSVVEQIKCHRFNSGHADWRDFTLSERFSFFENPPPLGFSVKGGARPSGGIWFAKNHVIVALCRDCWAFQIIR